MGKHVNVSELTVEAEAVLSILEELCSETQGGSAGSINTELFEARDRLRSALEGAEAHPPLFTREELLQLLSIGVSSVDVVFNILRNYNGC